MALTDNPMSLVVTGNVTVGATLEASVPTTDDIWYVGVTPNKSYTLKLSTDSETGTESGSVTISYSQSINNQTPKVTDY
jgi:hypothetical protein